MIDLHLQVPEKIQPLPPPHRIGSASGNYEHFRYYAPLPTESGRLHGKSSGWHRPGAPPKQKSWLRTNSLTTCSSRKGINSCCRRFDRSCRRSCCRRSDGPLAIKRDLSMLSPLSSLPFRTHHQQLPTTSTTIRSWPLRSWAFDQSMASTDRVNNMRRDDDIRKKKKKVAMNHDRSYRSYRRHWFYSIDHSRGRRLFAIVFMFFVYKKMLGRIETQTRDRIFCQTM